MQDVPIRRYKRGEKKYKFVRLTEEAHLTLQQLKIDLRAKSFSDAIIKAHQKLKIRMIV